MSRPLRGCRVTLAARPKSPYICSSNGRPANVHPREEERERERERRGERHTGRDLSGFDDASTRVHIHAHHARSLVAPTLETRVSFYFLLRTREGKFFWNSSPPTISGRGPQKGPTLPSPPLQPRVIPPLRPASLRSAARRSVLLLQLRGEREQSLPIDRRGIAPYAAHDRGSIDRKRRRVGLSAEIRGTGTELNGSNNRTSLSRAECGYLSR